MYNVDLELSMAGFCMSSCRLARFANIFIYSKQSATYKWKLLSKQPNVLIEAMAYLTEKMAINRDI